ncbi:MAG: uroporphyrinogen decarboxylase family protein [Bacteroidales bacterium]|nr:uroporphyrinogen decarboxylase family protein [Bacteroidales bacterium]
MIKTLFKKTRTAYTSDQRLICPLMGFPGLNLVNSTIKLAQQNYGEHYKVLHSLVTKFQPDIIFPLMDLSVEANALGTYTVFPKNDTPTVLKDHFDIADLTMQKQINIMYDTRLLGYVETVRLANLNFSQEIMRGAYVTGPYSLAGLIMGANEAAIAAIMEPEILLEMCEFAIERIQEYIRLLTGAGAQVICILEPTAVMLGPDEFEKFSSSFIKHIVNNYRYSNVSIIYHTCGNTMHLIEKMKESQVDGISLDSPKVGVSLPEVARILKNDTLLLGNIDPTGTILNGEPDAVKKEVRDLLQSMDFYPNFILSTGCDLPQEVSIENINAFMETGRQYRIGKDTKQVLS